MSFGYRGNPTVRATVILSDVLKRVDSANGASTGKREALD